MTDQVWILEDPSWPRPVRSQLLNRSASSGSNKLWRYGRVNVTDGHDLKDSYSEIVTIA